MPTSKSSAGSNSHNGNGRAAPAAPPPTGTPASFSLPVQIQFRLVYCDQRGCRTPFAVPSTALPQVTHCPLGHELAGPPADDDELAEDVALLSPPPRQRSSPAYLDQTAQMILPHLRQAAIGRNERAHLLKIAPLVGVSDDEVTDLWDAGMGAKPPAEREVGLPDAIDFARHLL